MNRIDFCGKLQLKKIQDLTIDTRFKQMQMWTLILNILEKKKKIVDANSI